MANYPTEKMIFHKQSGEEFNVVGMLGSGYIYSEDVTIPIETDDYFER